MILIAESGSSKTDWSLVGSSKTATLQTIGLNPYYLSKSEIARVIAKVLGEFVMQSIDEVYFYGAGCASEAMKHKMHRVLSKAFPTVKVHIETDLLGACRGLLESSAGIAGILGTGANSCYYDGQKVVHQMPSNGIWLGDEGSGGYFGKELITRYLNGSLPPALVQEFEDRYPDRRNQIINKVYRHKRPSAYLASYAPFYASYPQNEPLRLMLEEGFEKYFDQVGRAIAALATHEIHLTGSIACHFEPLVRKVAERKGVQVGQIRKSPMGGLIDYHQGVAFA